MRSLVKVLMIAIAGCAPVFAAEQTYCAFEVKVSSAVGKPRSGLPVIVVQNRQSTFSEARTNAEGIARLCDAPLESVDIAVGFDVCGLVMIRNLHPKWPKTITLFVTFEENTCEHFVLSEPCQVLLRVRDRNGKPLPGVRFVPADKRNGTGTDISDEFGRVFRVVRRGSDLRGKLEGPLATARVSLSVEDDKEVTVVLGK